MPLDITFPHKKLRNSMARNFSREIQDEKKEEEEDELLDFKKHSIFIDVLKNLANHLLKA